MGQANASLPDPLSEPEPSLAGTDDLLSQLAGDEIDRMLAEADVEPLRAPVSDDALDVDDAIADSTSGDPPAVDDPAGDALKLLDAVEKDAAAIGRDVAALGTASPTDAPAAGSAPAPAGDVEGELDALFDQINARTGDATTVEPGPPVSAEPGPPTTSTEPNAPAATVTPADVVPADSPLASELDDLFKQLTEPKPDATVSEPSSTEAPSAAAPTELPPGTAEAASIAPTASPNESPNSLGADANSATAERAALGLADLATSYAQAPAPAPSDADAPLPLLLRPLEWVNAPFAALPDGLRDLVGKAAIVTVVNAVAVILYVVLFRKG